MNNSYLPHDFLYTAETALIKKRKGGLSKIYIYPIDKNAKWYKPYPEYPSIDQDKYFFKYEYLDEIARNVNLLEQTLYQEQLNAVIEDEMKLNELKAEDRKIAELNNYFKNSLFTTLMSNVKENYIKSQAELLRKQNTIATGIDNIITDIKTADKETITLQSQNAEIQTEIDIIDEKINNYVSKKLEDYENDEENQDILEQIKDTLQKYNKTDNQPIYEPNDEERINKTFNEVGTLQKTELREIADEIYEISKEELQEITEDQNKLQQLLKEKQERDAEIERIKQVETERLNAIKDNKLKYQQIKKLNNAFLQKINEIQKDNKLFNKRIQTPQTKTKEILNNIGIANRLELLNEEEMLIIKNNFPDLRASTKEEKEIVRNNFNDLFTQLRDGFKPDLNQFIRGIYNKDIIQGLELNIFKKYETDVLKNLKKKFNDYEKIKISNIGIKSIIGIVDKGERLQKEAERVLNTELNTLLLPPIPNPEGQLWMDLPSTTPFEEEGGSTPFEFKEEQIRRR